MAAVSHDVVMPTPGPLVLDLGVVEAGTWRIHTELLASPPTITSTVSVSPEGLATFNPTTEGGLAPIQLTYEYGDGNIGVITEHQYLPGTYTAEITITDASGLSDTVAVQVVVVPQVPKVNGGDAIIVAATDKHVINQGENVTLTYSITNCSAAWLTQNHKPPMVLSLPTGSVVVGPLHYTQAFSIVAQDPQGGACTEHYSIAVKRNLPALDPNMAVTHTAKQDGLWSDPETWEGGAVPGEDSHAAVGAGKTVTVSGRLAPVGRLTLAGRLNIHDGILYATEVIGLEGAHLDMDPKDGEKALGVLQNRPRHPLDTKDVGRGVRFYKGTLTTKGRTPTHRARCLGEPKVGNTFVELDRDVTDWQVGDKIVLPNTYPFGAASKGCFDWADDICVIRKVEGRKIHFVHPLKFTHPARIDPISKAWEAGPPAEHLMRNVGFITTDPTDIETRGHIAFDSCVIDADCLLVHGTGRTDGLTTAGKNFTKQTRNEAGRHPIAFRRCTGKLDNLVTLDTFPLVDKSQVIWGAMFFDCENFQFDKGVSFNWKGAGIFCEHTTKEKALTFNSDDCCASRVGGDGQRDDQSEVFGRGGMGLWHKSPARFTNFWSHGTTFYGIVMHGWDAPVSAPPRGWYGHDICGPQFGFSPFKVSTSYSATNPNVEHGEYGPVTIWNVTRGIFAYSSGSVDIRGWVLRARKEWRMSNTTALMIHDYMWDGPADFIDCDVRGFTYGITPPVKCGEQSEGTHQREYKITGGKWANDIECSVELAWAVQPGSGLVGRDFLFAPGELLPWTRKAEMEMSSLIRGTGVKSYPLLLTRVTYKRPTDNKTYRTYALFQKADYKPVYYDPTGVKGIPEDGLTNTEALAKYGRCMHGEISPSDAVTVPWCIGVVKEGA